MPRKARQPAKHPALRRLGSRNTDKLRTRTAADPERVAAAMVLDLARQKIRAAVTGAPEGYARERAKAAGDLLARVADTKHVAATMPPDADRSVMTRQLKTCERRARLLGLDAPVRTELFGKDGEPLIKLPLLTDLSDGQLRERIEQLRAAAAALPAVETSAVAETIPPEKTSPAVSPEAAAYALELMQRAARNGGHNGNGNGNGNGAVG